MTTKTIPAYLEDERQKDCDARLRMEEEAAPKARNSSEKARIKPRAARKAATKSRKAA
jgi:hypothetical protein